MMKNIWKYYVVVCVVGFSFMVPVFGRTPAGWTLAAATWLVAHAPRAVNHRGTP